LLSWADDAKLLADCVSAAAILAGAVPLDSTKTFDELTKFDKRSPVGFSLWLFIILMKPQRDLTSLA
jgi:hypothetical protein